MQVVTLTGEIPSKKNSYQPAANGGRFKPKKITDFEEMVAKEVMAQAIREVLGQFTIEIEIYTKDNRRDIDNQATTIIDSLQDAGVYANDREMVGLLVAKHRVKEAKDVRAIIKIFN